jgi:hypothetical protein
MAAEETANPPSMTEARRLDSWQLAARKIRGWAKARDRTQIADSEA